MDGTGAGITFGFIIGLSIDSSGNIFVADAGNNIIRKLTPDAVSSTFVGRLGGNSSVDGTGTNASFKFLTGIVFDKEGNLYAADDDSVRKITPAGVVTTIANSAFNFSLQSDTGIAKSNSYLQGITADSKGNVYVSDKLNSVIKKITPDFTVSTMAGGANSIDISLGKLPGSLKTLNQIAIDAEDNLYVTAKSGVFKITP